MLLNVIKTQINNCKSKADSSTYELVQKLTQLASKKVNSMKLPACWKWKVEDVAEWLENVVKLPQYKSCIEVNFINGRSLLLLQGYTLIKMGIENFMHIKTIMESIRQLFNIEKMKFKRSICLPPKYPRTLYLEYRIPTGPTRESTGPTDLFKKIYILDDDKNYADSLTYRIPYIRFGLIKRKSVYNKIQLNRQPHHTDEKFINFLHH